MVETIERVVQGVLQGREPGAPIRVWVLGCATGEDPYSLAMTLLERLGEVSWPIQIFATDPSQAAIERARAGIYPESIARSVLPRQLERFFHPHERGYRIAKEVRDLCVFARHDITQDAPFSRLDLIRCNEALVLDESEVSQRLLGALHFALHDRGYLVLGAGASAQPDAVGDLSERFTVVDEKQRLYSRRPLPKRTVVGGARPLERRVDEAPVNQADRILIARYAPPVVLVDDQLDIREFRGRTGTYFDPHAGEASLNLLKMVRGQLAESIPAAMEQARETGAPARTPVLSVETAGERRDVAVEVIPLDRAPADARQYLVVFEEVTPPAEASGKGSANELELRQELGRSREYLRSVMEEHEATSLELHCANEEILASNDELQSVNEQLQAAHEELQSTNEELASINDDLVRRNAELSRSNRDLQTALLNVDAPIVFVGRDLRIRRFTPAAQSLFDLAPEDAGRPVASLGPPLGFRELVPLISEVIQSMQPATCESRSAEGRLYSLRIRPCRTSDNRIDGVVLTLATVDDPSRAPDPHARSQQSPDAAHTS